jgi:hypothetical protein
MITITGNGNTDVTIAGGQGGQYFLDASGTFGSGSIAVQVLIDGSDNYSPLTTAVGTDLAVTADYNAVVTLPGNSTVRFAMTGSSSPDVDVNLVKI